MSTVVVFTALAACGREESASERLSRQADEALQRASEHLDRAVVHAGDSLERMQKLFEGQRADAEVSLEQSLTNMSTHLEALVERLGEKSERGTATVEREFEQRLKVLRTEFEQFQGASEAEWRDKCQRLESEVDELARKLSEKLEQK